MNVLVARRRETVLVALFVLVFLVSGMLFARVQNVWIDESTQLSGVTVSIGRLFAWLAGAPEPSFGVPSDRTPPVSYLIDMACGNTVCGDPFAFRMLHLLIAAGGMALLLWVAARRYGLAAAAVAGLLLALSPKLTELGVEVRAYPIFFAISCVQIWQLGKLIDAERIDARAMLPFVALGFLAVNTHFFGLISTMAMLCGLIAARVSSVREGAPFALAGAAILVFAIALLPIIRGAAGISGEPVEPLSLTSLVQYVLKLAGHPATMISTLVALLFFAGLAGLLALGAWRGLIALRGGLAARRSLAGALVVALAAGLGVTLLAAIVSPGFDPLRANYSIWVLPMIAMLAAAAFRDVLTTKLRPAAYAAAILLALGAGGAQWLFLRNAAWFVHGPSSAIAAGTRDPATSAIIYTGDWGYGFFPVYRQYRAALPQYWLKPDGSLHRLLPGGGVEDAALGTGALAGRGALLLVDIRTASYRELARIHKGAPVVTDGASPRLAATSPALQGWRAGDTQTLPGLYWTTITPYRRDAAK